MYKERRGNREVERERERERIDEKQWNKTCQK